MANNEKVAAPQGGSDVTKNQSGTDPKVDSINSTEQVAGITPLREDASRRTMENVTADLNSTDTNLDQKYLSGTFMGDLIDYPINDISVTGSDSESPMENISSSSGSDDEDDKKPEELIEKMFDDKGYQLLVKGDKYVLLDTSEVEELLASRPSHEDVFIPLKSIKSRMAQGTRSLCVTEPSKKEGLEQTRSFVGQSPKRELT